MRTYPGTPIVDPSFAVPVSKEERRREAEEDFRIGEYMEEHLLFHPTSAKVFQHSFKGAVPVVYTDVLVLTGRRKGRVFSSGMVFNRLVVDMLTAVLHSPHAYSLAGKVSHHPVGSLGPTPAITLTSLSRESDIAFAAEQASALGWDTDIPATDKELLGWNLTAARTAEKITQAYAAQVMGMTQPTLSAIESGTRTVSALELQGFARLYRTTMARLLP